MHTVAVSISVRGRRTGGSLVRPQPSLSSIAPNLYSVTYRPLTYSLKHYPNPITHSSIAPNLELLSCSP